MVYALAFPFHSLKLSFKIDVLKRWDKMLSIRSCTISLRKGTNSAFAIFLKHLVWLARHKGQA